MPKDKTETPVATPRAGHGILGTSRDGGLPAEMIKSNEDFHDALANCWLRDEEQRNLVILYASQLKMFDMTEELEDLTNYLNASISINMASRAQALQGHVGMFFPSTSGMKVGKDELKFMAEANKASVRAKRNHDEEDGNKD